MNFFTAWRVRRAAKRDAELGINSIEQHVISAIGDRPVIDPSNLRQAGLVATTRTSPERRDWEADLRAREDAYADCTSPLVTLPALLLITVIEIWGGVRIMKTLGVGESDRVLFGVALGFGLLVLTVLVSRRAQAQTRGSSSWARRLGTVLLFVVYAIVIAALAYSRSEEAGTAASKAALWSEIVIMLAATAGPPWLAEVLWEAFTKARRLKRDIRRLRRDIRRDDRRRKRGERFTDRFGAEAEIWDRAAAEIRAIYTAEHRRASAVTIPNHPALPTRAERRDA